MGEVADEPYLERQSRWVECGIVDENLGEGVEGDGDHSVVDVGRGYMGS